MLRNYLITALRNLKRNKVYTFLNVIGLALGIGCALVIFKVISFETSFDKHQENYESIYRVVSQDIYPDRIDKGMGTPHPTGPAIKADFPEAKSVVRTNYTQDDQLNTYNEDGSLNKFLIEDGIVFTEPAFFDIFTVAWVAGDKESALTEPNTVVIATSEARKIFGLKEGEEHLAISKKINVNNIRDFQVVGVISDPPENSSLPFTYLFDYQGQKEINPYFYNGTGWNSTSSNTNTYFLAEAEFDADQMNAKLVDFVEKYKGEGESEELRYLVQPFSEIHFDEDYGSYTGETSLQFIYALGVIGLFLVLTACINFINLATAQAANRAKEIGIRKAIGSMSNQLVVQFMSEIALITLFAVLIALGISELMFSALSDIIGHELSLDLFAHPKTLLFLLILFVLVSLFSGFYPAILLSRMNVISALRSKISANKHSGGLSLRKGLVIFQFTISQFLIIGTLIVTSQSDFFLTTDMGFETEAILTTYLPERDAKKMELFRQQMMSNAAISGVTYSLSTPIGNADSHSGFNHPSLESENSYHGNFKPVDPYYTEFFGIDLLAGRTVREGDSNNIVVNQKIADLIGFKDRYPEIVGEKLQTGWGGDKTIVGVIQNFHTYTLEEDLDYVILLHFPEAFYNLSFKTASMNQVEEATAHFRSAWESIYPEYVIDYEFYDVGMAERYENIQNIMSLMRIFAIISIVIGCLGLYGLVSFIAVNKTKEIGVRKVLGASMLNILGLFSKEVLILISIAFIITTPVAFYLLNQWLNNFAFRIPIGIEFFVISFVITLMIALATISYKTITTALINPAETLKDD